MTRQRLLRHFAVWWRGPVTIADGLIIPSAPVSGYDPFTFYFPHEDAPRQGNKLSLPYQFLRVDPADEQDVGSFCERFGMLGTQIQDHPGRVRPDDAVLTGNENRYLLGIIEQPEESRDQYLRRLQVEIPSLVKDMSSLTAFSESQRVMREVIARRGNSEKDRRLLEYVFTLKAGMARPQLTWDKQEKRWSTGWNIGSLETAMYLMLLFDLQGGGRIMQCQRCGIFFLADHPNTTHCSASCQNVAKVARSRRLSAYAKHAGISKERARRALEAHGIDYSRPFDFTDANRRAKSYGQKRR